MISSRIVFIGARCSINILNTHNTEFTNRSRAFFNASTSQVSIMLAFFMSSGAESLSKNDEYISLLDSIPLQTLERKILGSDYKEAGSLPGMYKEAGSLSGMWSTEEHLSALTNMPRPTIETPSPPPQSRMRLF